MAQTAGDFPHGEWQRSYSAAMSETDLTKLAEKLHEAEAAIFERFQKLNGEVDNQAELIALDDAIVGLHVLKRETLRFPDWT
jgi:hypothetical protein